MKVLVSIRALGAMRNGAEVKVENCARLMLLVLGCLLPMGSAMGADRGLTRAALRARLALMRVHTAISADRRLYVSGPQLEGNALLLDAAEQIRGQIEALLGMPIPLEGQSVRLQVLTGTEEAQAGESGVRVGVGQSAGERVYRVLFSGYAATYEAEARERVIYAFLLAYCGAAPGDGAVVPELPAWLWQGVAAVLDPAERPAVLDRVRQDWMAGRLPSLAAVMAAGDVDRLDAAGARCSGAVVYWLTTWPSHRNIFRELFARLARGEPVGVDTLEVALGGDPDDRFDRWMLAQRRMIRGVGTVTQENVQALRVALLLSPGRDGIPRGVALKPGDGLSALWPYRDAPWFARAVRQRQQALQRVAPGRPERFRALVGEFVAVLEGLSQASDVNTVRAQEKRARAGLERMAADVQAAGGFWRVSE